MIDLKEIDVGDFVVVNHVTLEITKVIEPGKFWRAKETGWLAGPQKYFLNHRQITNAGKKKK